MGWGIVVCRLQPPPPADLGTVNALARLQLTARRAGCELRARGVEADLHDLWGWIGLRDIGPIARISPSPTPPPRRGAPRDR